LRPRSGHCDDPKVPRIVARRLPAAAFVLTIASASASIALSAGREPAYDTVFYALNAVVLGLAGLLICLRRPGHPIGWLLTGLGLEAGLVELAEGYGYHSDYPGAVESLWASSWGSLLGVGGTVVVLALFPTGRVPGPRWRPMMWAAVAGTALTVAGTAFSHSSDATFGSGGNPHAIDGIGIGAVYAAGQVLLVIALLTGVAAFVARFRSAVGVERQQLKWVAYVVCVLAVVGPAAIVAYHDSLVVRVAIAVVVTALPVAVCVAILRYRLYDIDVIINRTLVYGALTVVLASVYAVVVVGLGSALGSQRPAWLVPAATLLVAAAFLPVRRRVQDIVDRRFRRAHYDVMARVDGFLEDLRAGRTAPDRLEDLLREVLTSPDLEVRYLIPGATGHVDAHGDTAGVDEDDDRARTRIERAGVPLAVVITPHADESSDLAPALLEEVLARAGLAIEIARLQAEVKHQLVEVAASRTRIIAAGYDERRRLERDLHDGAQQRLVSIGLTLRHAQHQLGPSSIAETIDQAVAQISAAITDLRELANGIRPALLDEGLDSALRELAGRTPLLMQIHASSERFAADVEATAYFIACEGVTNAVKHSAAGTVELHAERIGGDLVLTIHDDGIGGAQAHRGSGLRGLADRAAAHGGRIQIISPHGHGTTLIAELPCAF
jgi:signal transduction histidine kinase